ncbi:MAG: DUF4350 domain-containing protein [Acidimicrobiia bacterium]
MSATTVDTGRSRRRGVFGWAAVIAVVVLVGIVAGAPSGSGRLLDPASTSDNGAKALIELARARGADVAVGSDVPSDPTGVALVLVDRLSDDQRGALDAWVQRGGRLVVTDPSSALIERTPPGLGDLFSPGAAPIEPGVCNIDAFDGIGSLEIGSGILLAPRSDDGRCFGTANRAFVVVRSSGFGLVVEIGGGELFTNDRLDDGDNAVLAAALLAPRRGEQVTVVDGAPLGSGDKGLWSLIPIGAKLAMLQLVIAFVAVLLWRSRRLGAPVSEALPTTVAASELVVATARLWQRSSAAEHAATQLRRQLRHDLHRRVSLSPNLAPEVAAAAIAEQFQLSPEITRRALTPLPVADADDLVAVSEAITRVRERIDELDPHPVSR